MTIWEKCHKNIMDNYNDGLLTDRAVESILWQLRNDLEEELLAEFDSIQHELKKSARRDM